MTAERKVKTIYPRAFCVEQGMESSSVQGLRRRWMILAHGGPAAKKLGECAGDKRRAWAEAWRKIQS